MIPETRTQGPTPVAVKQSVFMSRKEVVAFALIVVVLLVVFPTLLDGFRLNLVGKYLTYAFVALGLVLCWGFAGILSLGQGVFFGLGGYCLALFLKLEASSPEATKIQSTPGIPDFMDWNQITELPLMWQPFHSLTFALWRSWRCRCWRPSWSASRCSSAGSAASISPSSPRRSRRSSPS